MAKALDRRRTGQGGRCSRPRGGVHRTCSGKHSALSQKYPPGLCRAVLRGVRDQLRADNLLEDGCYGVQAPDDDAAIERELRGPANGYSGKYTDDLTGQVLQDSPVIEARAKELSFFYSKAVWQNVPKS